MMKKMNKWAGQAETILAPPTQIADHSAAAAKEADLQRDKSARFDRDESRLLTMEDS
jgi:hypothetical protein